MERLEARALFAAGALDPSFGDGRVLLDAGGDVVALPDGKLLLAGGVGFIPLARSGADITSVAALTVQSDGKIVTGGDTYQAEDAFLDGPVVKRDHSGYTGTGFADFVNNFNDTIEFQPQVQSTGTYTLEFRYANGSTVNRGLDLIVNGQDISPHVAFPPTGSWVAWRTATATVPLLGGGVNNSVILRAAGASGPNIDSMTVRPAQPLAVLQAENATLSGPVVRRDHSGYTGTGFADYVNNTGDYIEWTFDTPSLRTYALTFRYANGAAAARPLQLTINGLDEGRLSFAPTGSWSTWRTESFTIVLDGPRTFRVRLTAVGSNGANIDSLTVS